MADHRVYRTRARRGGEQPLPPPRRNGPACSSVTRKGILQRRRRTIASAKANVLTFLDHLIRLGVIVTTTLTGVSDVCRLKALAADLAELGMNRSTTIAVLILDFAARAPDLTKAFLLESEKVLLHRRQRKCVDTGCLVDLFKHLAGRQSWRCFWSGPTRLNMWSFVVNVQAADLTRVSDVLAETKRVRSSRVLSDVMQWKYFNTYTGFCMLRCVCEACGVKLRESTAAGESMSLHTRLLAALLPFDEAQPVLKSQVGVIAGPPLLSFFYCEAVKVLRHEGILVPLKHYDGQPMLFAEALADVRFSRLLSRMMELQACSDSEASETELVNRHFPAAGEVHHAAQQTLKRWLRRTASSDAKKRKTR